MKKTGKIKNAVIAFLGIFVILFGVIAYVDHVDGLEKKSKEVALATLEELDGEFTDENVTGIQYKYEPKTGLWYEVYEYADGHMEWNVF